MLHDGWIFVVIGELVERYGEAAQEEYIVVLAVFVDTQRPTGAALGVSRRQMGGQSHAAKFNALAIGNDAIWLYGFIGQLVTPIEISFSTAHHKLAIKLAADHFRTGSAF